MNIIDIAILLFLLIGAYRGWKYGVISSFVSLLGVLLVFTLSYYLKNPLSAFMYENMPFYTFGGIFSGVSSFNIIVYEGIAYIICIFVLIFILRVILKLTGILDKLLKMTIIFTLPSKIMGACFGFLEFFIYGFAIIFFLAQMPFSASSIASSTVGTKILKSTPVLSTITNNLYSSANEIYEICTKNQNKTYMEKDYESLDVLLKYDIVSPESVMKMRTKGKVKIENVDDLINKYMNGSEKND